MVITIEQGRSPLKHGSRHKSENGFTLVELLIVLAIIGALAAIAIPAYTNYVDKAQRTIAVSTLNTIRNDLEVYHLEFQEYPPEPADILTSFFYTGIDSSSPPRPVFKSFLTDQIVKDITPVSYTYNSATVTYTFTATAKNKSLTLMSLTPEKISY